MSTLFQSQEVSRITGVTARQIQYWDETDFITPSVKTTRRRKYSFQDLVLIKIASQLLEADHSLQELRKGLTRLRRLLPQEDDRLAEMVVLTDGLNFLVHTRDGYFASTMDRFLFRFDLGELAETARLVKETKHSPPPEQLPMKLASQKRPS